MAVVKRKKTSGGKTKPLITAWSFSRLKDYEQCPAKAKYKHVDKLDTGPAGPALQRGSAIHKDAERYLKGEVKDLPESLQYLKAEYASLRKRKAISEGQWALSVNMQPTDWFGPQAWLRVVVDACVPNSKSVLIADLKTGKSYPDHEDQLSLYAWAGFATFQNAKKIQTELLYSDLGEVASAEYVDKDVPELDKYWRHRSAGILSDYQFKPTPSARACKWCDFHQEKGAPCKVGFEQP